MAVSADHVLQVLDALAAADVAVWVDGGWGVDALLGEQTREHGDLDVVAALDDVSTMLVALGRWGVVMAEDHRPVRCVLSDTMGRQLDVHTVRFDSDGGGIQPQPAGGSFRYPPEGFATGSIGGRAVPCIAAAVQLLCHTGYEPDETDRHDVRLLGERFHLELPEAYR